MFGIFGRKRREKECRRREEQENRLRCARLLDASGSSRSAANDSQMNPASPSGMVLSPLSSIAPSYGVCRITRPSIAAPPRRPTWTVGRPAARADRRAAETEVGTISGLMSAAQPGRRGDIGTCRFEKALAYESAVCIEKPLPAGIFGRNRHTSTAFIGATSDFETAADQPATLLALKTGRCHSELTGKGCRIDNPCAVWVAFKSHGVPSLSHDSFGGLRCTVTHPRGRQGKTCYSAIAALQPGGPWHPQNYTGGRGPPAFLAPRS